MADSEPTEQPAKGAGATAKGTVERVELSRHAQALARRVAESKATIPHGYLQRSVPVAGAEADSAGQLPLLARIVAAAAAALREHPALNGSYRDGGIELHSRVNIAFGVETDEGPLMPTLFDADEMSVAEIGTEIETLSERALAGSLTAPESSGATFTLSDAGAGADHFAGTVTPGQVAHLGIGRAGLRGGGAVGLTLSFDQRALRAPGAADFLGSIAAALTGIDPEQS